MDSIRAVKPVKLFVVVLEPENGHLEERLEKELISEYGPTDHRLSLISSDGTIQRVFLSFDRLTDEESLPQIREHSKSLEEAFSAQVEVGFLDNRRAALGTGDCRDLLQFKNGGIHFFPQPQPGFMSDKSQEFFLQMRQSFRARLRSLCLLRR